LNFIFNSSIRTAVAGFRFKCAPIELADRSPVLPTAVDLRA
jgi:hypothetical protein